MRPGYSKLILKQSFRERDHALFLARDAVHRGLAIFLAKTPGKAEWQLEIYGRSED